MLVDFGFRSQSCSHRGSFQPSTTGQLLASAEGVRLELKVERGLRTERPNQAPLKMICLNRLYRTFDFAESWLSLGAANLLRDIVEDDSTNLKSCELVGSNHVAAPMSR